MGGYSFKGKRGKDAPRKSNYTFYLAALDDYGNYSEPLEFTIQHPGIQKLDLTENDITGFINSLKIHLPTPYSIRSQEVYPEKEENEEKEILGYRLFVQELDFDTEEPIGDPEIIDFRMEDISENGVIYYQASTGKKFEIKLGCFDSVYHPIHNSDLFEDTISDPVIGNTFKVERPDISEALIKPNDLTTTLQGEDLVEGDFGEGGIESTFTVQAGIWDEDAGEPIVGGIGLAYNEDENDIDVQIIADRFRLFDPDVDPDGKSIFATGTVDGESQIYMNANNISMIAEKESLNENEPFFNLSKEGLSINTPGFKLDKDGNAIFAGELEAASGKLGDDNDYVYFDGDTLRIKSEELSVGDGEARFTGTVEATKGFILPIRNNP